MQHQLPLEYHDMDDQTREEIPKKPIHTLSLKQEFAGVEWLKRHRKEVFGKRRRDIAHMMFGDIGIEATEGQITRLADAGDVQLSRRRPREPKPDPSDSEAMAKQIKRLEAMLKEQAIYLTRESIKRTNVLIHFARVIASLKDGGIVAAEHMAFVSTCASLTPTELGPRDSLPVQVAHLPQGLFPHTHGGQVK
jgi:hypothetical protein